VFCLLAEECVERGTKYTVLTLCGLDSQPWVSGAAEESIKNGFVTDGFLKRNKMFKPSHTGLRIDPNLLLKLKNSVWTGC
jgi:hypothetical protein